MKILLSVSLLFSFFIYADGHKSDKPMYEPNVAEYYVSSFKEVSKRWRPEVIMQQTKQVAHRARADVFESINELRFYRDEFFAKK